MRPRLRTLALLGFCAAALAAAVAHVAIDVLGDFLLPHDAYDAIAHTSRDFVTGIALLAGCALAWKALRACVELASANRGSAAPAIPGRRIGAAFVALVALLACAIVPAMELLDGRFDGVPVLQLDDAFGGSLVLGIATTVACAMLVAAVAFALVRWLLSHRDSIVAMLVTIFRIGDAKSGAARIHLSARRRPVLRRARFALVRPKRGPPDAARLTLQRLIALRSGDPHVRSYLARRASAWRARPRVHPSRTRECRALIAS